MLTLVFIKEMQAKHQGVFSLRLERLQKLQSVVYGGADTPVWLVGTWLWQQLARPWEAWNARVRPYAAPERCGSALSLGTAQHASATGSALDARRSLGGQGLAHLWLLPARAPFSRGTKMY